MLTIDALVFAKLIHKRIVFQLSKVKQMLTSTGNNSFRAISYQIRQQQQTLQHMFNNTRYNTLPHNITSHASNFQNGGIVVLSVEYRTCDQEVVGSSLGRAHT